MLVLAVPWLQDFFALKPVGVTMPWVAVGIAVATAAALELVRKWADRRFPAYIRYGPRVYGATSYELDVVGVRALGDRPDLPAAGRLVQQVVVGVSGVCRVH